MLTARRIAIVGTSGAGKTTLGRALASRLAVPFVECDALAHQAGWRRASDDELRQRLDAALADHDGWVIDGTFQRRIGDFVSGRVELIVWLDLPLGLKLLRLCRRSWRRVTRRELLWNGNVETWRDVFVGGDSVLQYTVRAHLRDRRQWPNKPHWHKTLRLSTQAEVDRWLAAVTPAARAAPAAR
jgi:adenylate kinase family enzyme